MKTCSKCKQAKSLDEFYKNNARHNALQSWCKQCKADAGRAARQSKPRRDYQPRICTSFGEKHYNAKLTNADVLLIRGLFDWLTNVQIAEKFEVHPSTISAIKHRRSWWRV